MHLEYMLWRHWEELRKVKVRKCEKWCFVVHYGCMVASSHISLSPQSLVML